MRPTPPTGSAWAFSKPPRYDRRATTKSGDGDTGLEFLDLRKTRDPGLLKAVHHDLFLPNFPDPDEQEGPDDWSRRLWEDPAPPQPEQYGFVAGTNLGSAAQRSLAGFAFVERYRESRCALLSYIAVDKSQRGQGLGRKLFDRAFGSAQKAAQQDDGPIRAVFAEIHDPRRVNPANDVIDPDDRVRIMERLGAWRVPISYVQPALGKGSERSDRLMLVAFPLDGKPIVDADAVWKFLSEYYCALGVEDPSGDPDLMRIEKELEKLDSGRVDLVSLAQPSLPFTHFSVVLHFVATNPDMEVDAQDPKDPFASFEEDLLSYRFVPGRPRPSRLDPSFKSLTVKVKVKGDPVKEIALSVPAPIPYYSEGKKKDLYLPGPLAVTPGPPAVKDLPGLPLVHRWRTFAVKASRTDFYKSRYSVFHLAFVNAEPPRPDSVALDEYDLVALSKLWQGGEIWEAAHEICLHPEPHESMSVGPFAQEVFSPVKAPGDSRARLGEFLRTMFRKFKKPSEEPEAWEPRVRVGTIQLIAEDQPPSVNWMEIWNSVTALIDDKDGTDDDDEKGPIDKQVTALGGILQGILDFQAIDATELTDVFKGTKVDATGLVGIHKGTLLCVMKSDRSYEAVTSTIGVSPYLLIPQAVLLHNEELLDAVARRAEQMEKEKDAAKLEDCFKLMRIQLASYVPNVFHYPQERWLFSRGEKTRGLSERRKELTEQAAEIETRWKVAVEKRRSFADTIRNVLLALIGLSTFPYVHGVGLVVGLSGLALGLVILSLHSNPRWSWSSPRSWWSVVRRKDNPGTT